MGLGSLLRLERLPSKTNAVRLKTIFIVILLIVLSVLSSDGAPPMPPRQKMIAKRVLQSPRESGVQVNAPMVRAEAVTLLPNSKLVWDYDPAQITSVNFTVWESQDLRTWRVIGTVTAPVGTATATEFDLGFSVFQTAKPYAFWRVSVAWKV